MNLLRARINKPNLNLLEEMIKKYIDTKPATLIEYLKSEAKQDPESFVRSLGIDIANQILAK